MCCEQTYCYLLTAGPGGDDATVCRHGRSKCQLVNTMDRSVQCVGMEVSALLNHKSQAQIDPSYSLSGTCTDHHADTLHRSIHRITCLCVLSQTVSLLLFTLTYRTHSTNCVSLNMLGLHYFFISVIIIVATSVLIW